MKTIKIIETHYIEVPDGMTEVEALEKIEDGEIILDENTFDRWDYEDKKLMEKSK